NGGPSIQLESKSVIGRPRTRKRQRVFNKMTKKRAVFLFGAGATLEWNSPTTRELTDLIRETGFRTSNNTTTITDFIYSTLLESGYPSHAINFETIISVIEELVVYYSKFDT